MNYKAKLKELLNEIKEELKLNSEEYFNIQNYAIIRMYNKIGETTEDNKIILNKDVFDSYGQKLKLHAKTNRKEIKELDDLVDDEYIKNLIKHEEAHRVERQLNYMTENRFPTNYAHNLGWAYLMITFNASFPDLIVKEENESEIEIKYKDIDKETLTSPYRRIIFLYESDSEKFNELIKKIKVDKCDNKEGFIAVNKQNQIILLFKDKNYLVKASLNLNKKQILFHYKLIYERI